MTSSDTKTMFALRVKTLRESRGLSQKSLASCLNAAQSTVAGWETRVREPTLQGLENLAKFFGVSLDYLLGRTDNPLSIVPNETPYVEVTPFEKSILEAYRALPKAEQTVVCRSLGLIHPADERARIKNA